MAFAREVRLPFLDYRLVELMLNAPTESKLNAGWTKYSLRQAFSGWLPPEIVWRRDKQGFSMPQEEWLRGELKSSWLAVLNPDAQVFQRKLVNHDALHAKFERFCARQGNIWYREIFAPLALEIWLQAYSEFIE
jgi:asparagine synthase (glutamine-hydrolysing)